MTARAFVTAVLVLAAGCGQRNDAPPPNRGIDPTGESQELPPPAAPVVPAANGRPSRAPSDPYQPPRRGREALTPTTVPTTITVETPRPPEAPPEAPPRDPSAELRSMMGSPGSCAPASALENVAASVTLSVQVMTMPSGTIARASVSGGGLPREVTACLEQRAMGLRFSPPVEGAPRSISTTLTLERRALPTKTP